MHQTLDKKGLFVAEEPQKLEKLNKRLRRKVVDAEILLESILPGLIKLPKQYKKEPKVTFYSGIEGIKNMALEASVSPDKWLFFGSSTKVLEKLVKYGRMDIFNDATDLRRGDNRSKISVITDAGILSLGGIWAKTKTPWREMKILPGTIESGSGFIIFEDKLFIFTLENTPFAAVIKSKEVIEVLRVMYQLIWKSLPTN